MLGEKDPATGHHALGFRIGNSDAVLTAGRAVGRKGYCYTCKGTSNMDPKYGYQSTVRGTIQDLGDGSDGVAGTPLLTDIEMLDASIGCDGNPTGLSSGTLSSGSRKLQTTGFVVMMISAISFMSMLVLGES